MVSKKELRKAMNARLHGLTVEEKTAASAAVCARLAALPQYQQACRIMAFLHMSDEVSLDGLIQQALADGKGSELAVGGMATKLRAAKMVTAQGCDMVITNGEHPEVLYDIAQGKPVGTRFLGRG